MRVSEAQAILGVGADDDRNAVRSAYRSLLLRTHPDVSRHADAAARTMRLTTAYTTLLDPAVDAAVDRDTRDHDPSPDEVPEPGREPVVVTLVGTDTIGVEAPANETLMLLIDAAHRLGEITYLDPAAGLIEVVVEFVEAPTSSILMTLQGRATGTTEINVTVEPLSGGSSPPGDAVTRLVLRTLIDDAA